MNSKKGRLVSEFEYHFDKTPYVLFGDWFVWFSLFFVLIIIFVFGFRTNHSRFSN
jgi:apolipoprotein N-acyltransferase